MRALIWLSALFVFATVGSAICSLLARMSGWRALAEAYPLRGALPAARRSFVGGRVGSVSYHGCLHVAADTAGLYVSVMALFSAGHEPLFIPWTDISVSPSASPYGPVVRLQTRAVPASALELPLDVAAWVKVRARFSAWPGDIKILN
jgi:hypothetical protein